MLGSRQRSWTGQASCKLRFSSSSFAHQGCIAFGAIGSDSATFAAETALTVNFGLAKVDRFHISVCSIFMAHSTAIASTDFLEYTGLCNRCPFGIARMFFKLLAVGRAWIFVSSFVGKQLGCEDAAPLGPVAVQ